MSKTKLTDFKKESNVKEKKVSRTLEAARRLKGSLIVNDPVFLL